MAVIEAVVPTTWSSAVGNISARGPPAAERPRPTARDPSRRGWSLSCGHGAGRSGGTISRQRRPPTAAGRDSDVTSPGRIRVVVAKPGLDGHDRGAKVVARALRDGGIEVIYTGLHQTPDQLVETTIQEDADDVGVFGGGIVPEADLPLLEQMGVAKIFTPGATTKEIVEWVVANVGERVA